LREYGKEIFEELVYNRASVTICKRRSASPEFFRPRHQLELSRVLIFSPL
jgi:hypothetical protein